MFLTNHLSEALVNHVPADSQLLDLDHLRRQTAGEAALEGELLALFEAQCERLIPIVATGRGSGQRADAAHTLIGSARAVGAWRAASTAEAVEAALRGGDEEKVKPALAALNQVILATRRAVAQRVRATAASA